MAHRVEWLLAPLICASIVLMPGESWAEDPALAKPRVAQAQSHLAQGNRLYNVRKFEEAAAEYVAGAVIESAPVFDYNLGQCYRKLGRYDEAMWHYERFLTYGTPGEELRTYVEDFIVKMKAEKERRAMTQPPNEVAPEPTSNERPRSQPASPAPRDPGGSSWYADATGWILVGGGIVGAGTGGLLLLSASNLRDEAAGTASEDRRVALREAADRRSVAATVAGLAGAAFLIGGIVKLAIHADSSTSVGVVSWGSGDGGGLVVFGRF